MKASIGSLRPLDCQASPPTAQLDEAWLQDRLRHEEQPDNAISVPIITRNWDGTSQQCRNDLEEAAEKLRMSKKAADKAEQWPGPRKRAQIDDEAWAWRSVKDRVQRLWDAHEAMCFRVSLGTYEHWLWRERRIRIRGGEPSKLRLSTPYYLLRRDVERYLQGFDAYVALRGVGAARH